MTTKTKTNNNVICALSLPYTSDLIQSINSALEKK